jgi:Xaa-Pro aminopeptidase
MNRRIYFLQNKMKELKVDCAFYATSAAMQYLLDDPTYFWQRTIQTGSPFPPKQESFSGHFQNMPDAVLVIPASGDPTIVLTAERAKTMRPAHIKQLIGSFYELGELLGEALCGTHFLLSESCRWYVKELLLEQVSGCTFADGETLVEEMRKIKEPKEVEALREAAAFTDEAMRKLVPLMQPGITQRDLQHAIGDIARENGLDLSFPPAAIFVHTDAPNADQLFSYPLDEPLKPGSSIGFDFGFLKNGYVSDYGRSFYCGEAPDEIKRGYEALQRAQVQLIESIRPGMRIGDCFQSLYRTMEETGYGNYLRRSPQDIAIMGHQIGIDTHERPWIHDEQNAVFEPGMVMCIEPKLWWPGKCYLRCEDMVHITENGAEFLTNFDRSLFALPIQGGISC